MSTLQLLNYVQEGMDVYDRRGNKIGKVGLVFSGADEYETGGADQPILGLDETLVPDAVRKLFPPDRVPDVVRKRLFQIGFLKINTGLLGSDRYVLSNQIETVLSDSIYLNVDKDEMLKF
jgi:hypothetical protein